MNNKDESPYLFDTNIVLAAFYKEAEVLKKLANIPANRRLIPIIAVWEIVHGANKQVEVQRANCLSGKPHQLVLALRNFDAGLAFLSPLNILPYDDDAQRIFNSLDKRFRINKRASDSMIAAIALSRGLTVVTRNYDDFKEIPGLAVEDWRKDKG